MKDFTLGACCVCEKSGPFVRTLLSLDRLCPTPGRGWGCVVCDIPADGAMAVLCDDCAEDLEHTPDPSAHLKFACTGYPGTDGRVPFAELTGEFKHRDVPH